MSTDNLEGKDFVHVYMPMAGWKACFMVWDEEYGFHEPWETSIIAYSTKAAAVEDAKEWAEDLGVPFVDTCPDDTDDAPKKTVTEQLLEIFPDAEVINLNDI